MFPDWFVQGLMMGGFWLGTGLIIARLAKNRVIQGIRDVITGYIVDLMADIAQNPEKIKPTLDAIMKSVLANPAGVMPKEAMIKIPLLGRVPASWFEPIIKSQLGKIAQSTGEQAVKNTFGS